MADNGDRITPCECAESGECVLLCKRHQVRKGAHWRKLCRTDLAYFELWEQGSGPGQNVREHPLAQRARKPKRKGLGDRVEQALTFVGITKERVEEWLGRPCGCNERRERLNQLGAWAARVLLGKTEQAEEYLEEIID